MPEIPSVLCIGRDNRTCCVKDHVGSIRVTVDAAGTVVAYNDYYPFGMLMEGRNYASGAWDAGYKFTGKERDIETNYDYFGARYYDARIGRWLAVDPLAEKYPGWSAYNYCKDNPINRIDPDGERDVIFHIQRNNETHDATLGSFSLTNSGDNRSITGVTLEKLRHDNAINVSRINADNYRAQIGPVYRKDSKLKGLYLRLEDKNGRSGVLIHPGVKESHSEGCPLIGKTIGKEGTSTAIFGGSDLNQDMLGYIWGVLVQDYFAGEYTTLNVVVSDMQPKNNSTQSGNNEQSSNSTNNSSFLGSLWESWKQQYGIQSIEEQIRSIMGIRK